jgi:hypothetical protein
MMIVVTLCASVARSLCDADASGSLHLHGSFTEGQCHRKHQNRAMSALSPQSTALQLQPIATRAMVLQPQLINTD